MRCRSPKGGRQPRKHVPPGMVFRTTKRKSFRLHIQVIDRFIAERSTLSSTTERGHETRMYAIITHSWCLGSAMMPERRP